MREGLIPAILGTAVVATGISLERKIMRKSQMVQLLPMITAGVIGFGLAHIVLGSIDLCTDNKE
jgi:formate/nitrite transporter FocA (FNT family)